MHNNGRRLITLEPCLFSALLQNKLAHPRPVEYSPSREHLPVQWSTALIAYTAQWNASLVDYTSQPNGVQP
jgi:hypothetical protein